MAFSKAKINQEMQFPRAHGSSLAKPTAEIADIEDIDPQILFDALPDY